MEFPSSFEAKLYGDLTPTLNPNVLKGRVRVFYRGLNANNVYIDEKTADYIIQHAAATPVVGTYSPDKADFEGHNPSTAQIYGCIPYPTNFAWEKHIEDGIEREYACFDVWIFTYKQEHGMIIGKQQSMEMDKRTLRGEWTQFEGKSVFRYIPGVVFAGLCILGDSRVPCFKESEFYEAPDSLMDFMLAAQTVMQTSFNLSLPKGGKKEMGVVNLGNKHANFDKIFLALNASYTEENEFLFSKVPFNVGEDSFSVLDVDTFELSLYTYSVDEDGSIVFSLTESFDPAAEKTRAVQLQADYEAAQQENEDSKKKVCDSELEIGQLNEKVVDLNTQIESFQTGYVAVEQFNLVSTELNSLKEKITQYEKDEFERQNDRKNQLLASYEGQIPADDYTLISGTVETLTYEELESKLAVSFSNFTRSKNPIIRVPIQAQGPKSQLVQVLEKYAK